jgi:hypothetical protein
MGALFSTFLKLLKERRYMYHVMADLTLLSNQLDMWEVSKARRKIDVKITDLPLIEVIYSPQPYCRSKEIEDRSIQ